MSSVAILGGLAFMLLCVCLVVMHSLSRRRVTLFDWSMLAMGALYGGGWALVVTVTAAGENPFWSPWLLPNQAYYPLHTVMALVLLGGLWLGWLLPFGFRGSQGEAYVQGRVVRQIQRDRPRLTAAAWFMLALAFCAQWIYVQAYGGFLGLLDYAAMIRSAILPTPLNRNREPDLSYVERTAEAIAPHLRAGQLIVLESTTYPGTTTELLRPILERLLPRLFARARGSGKSKI
jgi:hypothetical protein